MSKRVIKKIHKAFVKFKQIGGNEKGEREGEGKGERKMGNL